ncbi:MAG: hypothetical protein A2152_00100 [Candidatus Levybacteria bacterium RBG_16_35_6]|nr:MAG: hypothetical protein A2152_00100 [Candidatus Levybacteria bacterium RBG_16_35_6]
MNTAVINIKTESTTKKQAQELASRLGLSLSALINAYLKELIKTRRVTFSTDEMPSPYLIKAIKQAEENYKKGKTSPTFTNIKDAITWLENPNAKYKNGNKV